MRPRILVLVRSYLPGFKFGGPIQTIANMVEQLGDRFEFRIITSDRDLGDDQPYRGVPVDQWCTVGQAYVYYASPRWRSPRGILALIRSSDHDVLYLNSLFDPVFSIPVMIGLRCRLLSRRPTIVAPRGELSPGALRLKAWKKRAYLFLSRLVHLYDGVIWHASTTLEADEIRRALGSRTGEVIVAPDLVRRSYDGASDPALSDSQRPLRIVFLSRISPMKNLLFALRVLANVRAQVEFHIFGPIDDEAYWERCQAAAAKLPGHVTVRYMGAIPHDAVPRTLAGYDLFFLPTLGENFGHAIREALDAGVPVLISDRTPWVGLREHGVGYDLPLTDMEAFVNAIEQEAAMSGESRRARRGRVRAFVAQMLPEADALERNIALFTEAARRRGTGAGRTR